MVAALVLSLVGVPDADIVDDYVLTDARMAPCPVRVDAQWIDLGGARARRVRGRKGPVAAAQADRVAGPLMPVSAIVRVRRR